MPKTLVKLRRTPSDTPRPASTPPVIAASAIQDEDDEEKILAELEVRQLLKLLSFVFLVSSYSKMFSPHYFINKKIFQRTPVKGSASSKQSSSQPKATPPCVFGSLGRKVKPQATAFCCHTPRSGSSNFTLFINYYLFPTLLNLPCRLNTSLERRN